MSIIMIKIFNKILVIITLCLFITGCNSVKKAFDPQRKNSSEEFLVEKKSPLSMPPEFDKESQISNIDLLITEKDSTEKSEIIELDKDFEQLILDKIKNN